MKHKSVTITEVGAIRLRSLIAVIIVLILLGGGGLLARHLYVQAHSGARAAAQKFVDYMLADDSNNSYAMSTDRFKASVGSRAAWDNTVEATFKGSSAAAIYKQMSAVPNPVPTYGKTADPQRVTYDLKFTDGRTYGIYVIVLKDKAGSWKIDEYSSYPK